MSKKRPEPEDFRPDPNRPHPPIDQTVQLPYQVRRAAAVANALSAGQPVAAVPKPNITRSEAKIALSDAEIDEALQQLDRGDLKVTDAHFATIIELAREGARLIKAHRRGAREPRGNSQSVTRRQEAIIQAFRELSPKRQKYPTGTHTITALRAAVIQKLSLRDEDDGVSEDTIRQDIRQLRPVIRLIQRGLIPPPGKPLKQKELSDKTRQEMEAGARAVAKAAAAPKPRRSTR
jgi:hypothetical protein